MNNEAITTAADHRAPPVRPTLPDWGGGGGLGLFPPRRPPARCRNTGFSLCASLNEFSGEFLFVGV